MGLSRRALAGAIAVLGAMYSGAVLEREKWGRIIRAANIQAE